VKKGKSRARLEASAKRVAERFTERSLRLRDAVAGLRPLVRPRYRSDQLLVTLDSDVMAHDALNRLGAREARVTDAVEGPFAALELEGLIEDITAIGQPNARGARVALAASVRDEVGEELMGVNLFRLAPKASIDEVRRRLDDVPGVREVERVPYRTIVPPSAPRAASARRAAGLPWNLRAIRWEAITPPDAKLVKVAVLDSGVDEGHVDLKIAQYEHEDSSAEDIVGHGTHVCGIIAGKRSRSADFHSGVCNATLHVWKIFDDEPDPETGDYVVDEVHYQRAMVAAQRAGCRVINLSIGGYETTTRERALVKRLVDAGVVIIAAMGNEYQEGNPTEYPAALPGVIAVGAVGKRFERALTSNTGKHIALVAPGVAIPSTLPRKPSDDRDEVKYAEWDGTSMAAPHVAAAAARLLAREPALTPQAVKQALQDGARKLTGMHRRGWTRLYGAGLLQL
jgi:subtilisin family serine protease